MIPPRGQWCLQIEVTNRCGRDCSNCTRALHHSRYRFDVDLEDFARACEALAEFPCNSPPDDRGRTKVVGLIGGEPLLHPRLQELVEILCHFVPDACHRGLWTSVNLDRDQRGAWLREKFGFINENRHDSDCFHQPVLLAIEEVIHDRKEMWRLIDRCWVQRYWSGTITPKGFFFCEVAGALDWIFGGPGGLPVDSDCWRHDLDAYREQIERWCPRCGCALPFPGRRDREGRDDVTPENLKALKLIHSPALERVVCFDPNRYRKEAFGRRWNPERYRRPTR